MAGTDMDHSDTTTKTDDSKPASSAVTDNHVDAQEPTPPKPSLLKKMQTKLGLDVPTVLLMLKSVSLWIRFSTRH